jgi:hypothetical protein
MVTLMLPKITQKKRRSTWWSIECSVDYDIEYGLPKSCEVLDKLGKSQNSTRF